MKATNFKKAVSFFAIASVFTMAGCQQDENIIEAPKPNLPAEATTASGKVIAGSYIVVFKDNGHKTTEIINGLVAANEVSPSNINGQLEGKIKGFTGKLSPGQLKGLLNNPDVATIEPDQVISLHESQHTGLTAYSTEAPSPTYTMPAQPAQTVPWGVNMVGRGDGSGKTAWVIDSGVDVYHPDLNVDIPRSLSFVTGLTSVQDGYGHGTMVAGIIGAKNNSIGVVGVAANASIVALRVLDNAGSGTLSSLIRAVNHVSANGKAGDVVNISIGAAASSTLDNAIKTAAAKGIFFSIAAGNNAKDCSTTSPQRVNATNVYTVSAMDANKYFWSSSNYGAPVDKAAPGVNISTTGTKGSYTYGHGTSFAAPHVAGLLLLKGNYFGSNGPVIGDRDSWVDQIAKL